MSEWRNGRNWSQRQNTDKWISLAIGVGIVLAAIGVCVQITHTIQRVSYTVVEGEVIEQGQWTANRSGYRYYSRPRYSTIVCKAKVSFVVDGVTHVSKASDLSNKCYRNDGEKVKVAYDPKDIYGTATTKVYTNNIHPAAVTLLASGALVGVGSWGVSYLNKQYKTRKRKI